MINKTDEGFHRIASYGEIAQRALNVGTACQKRFARRFVFLLLAIACLIFSAGCGRTEASGDDNTSVSSDGRYAVAVALEGGSGRTSIASPTLVTIADGEATATIRFSSSHYDYMLVDDVKYTPVRTESGSEFEVPLVGWKQADLSGATSETDKYISEEGKAEKKSLAEEGSAEEKTSVEEGTAASESLGNVYLLEMIADTTAMSTPHEIEYTIRFDLDSMTEVEPSWQIGEAVPGMWGDSASGNTQESQASGIHSTNADDRAVSTSASASDSEGGLVTHPEDVSSQLTYSHSLTLDYAKEFAVDYYENDYVLLSVSDGAQYLVVPEGEKVPDDLDADVVVLRRPFAHIYMAASAVMDLFDAMGALDTIDFTSTKADSWYLPNVATAMEAGEISYVGKYSEPDYEMLLAAGASIAVESTMILHAPEVEEKFNSLGIPVITDHSSYEDHPLGRTEWVKFYGAMLGKDDEALAAFDAQKEAVETVEASVAAARNRQAADAETDTDPINGGKKSDEAADAVESGEQTAVIFYVSSSTGALYIRRPGDYVSKMVELAGGAYLFDELTEGDSSSVELQFEEFYAGAKDADVLIYNATLGGDLTFVEELISKNTLFADFKAVKDGNVWITNLNFYQSTMSHGEMIADLYAIFSGSAEDEELTYFRRLE